MKKYNKVIFVCMDNLCRSPVAEAIMKTIMRDSELSVVSRGIVVLFSEPYNLRARSVLLNNGTIMENGKSTQLQEEDFAEDTLVLTMDRNEKQKILEEFEHSQNVYTIMEFSGGSGDILDPYGGDLEVYTLLYESISLWVAQAEQELYRINTQKDEDIES